MASKAALSGLETKPQSSSPRDRSELGLLHQISSVLAEGADFEATLADVLDALSSQLGFRHGTITLYNRATGQIAIDVASGLTAQQARRGRYELGEGVTGEVVATGEPAVIPQVAESPIFLDRVGRGRSRDLSFLCVPIKASNEVCGTLSVDRDYDEAVDLDRDLKLLSLVASMLGQVVKARRALEEERRELEEENLRLRAQLRERRGRQMIGRSDAVAEIERQVEQVAVSDATVLILGETGTGKELVADAVHYASARASGPLVKVHCAALPESIVESELFGHERGAFTGAVESRPGRFELAQRGTLFLDEIGEVPLSLQVKLLRVLQERQFERVGGVVPIDLDVRVIAATNRDLEVMVEQGSFRRDLYYRLNVYPITVPPLRERRSDIVVLADTFVARSAERNGRSAPKLTSAVIDMIMSYHWPGNVRELESCIERAVLLARDGAIEPQHLPPTLQTAEATDTTTTCDLKAAVEDYERRLIGQALRDARGNMSQAARALSTTQRIIRYKVNKYGLS